MKTMTVVLLTLGFVHAQHVPRRLVGKGGKGGMPEADSLSCSEPCFLAADGQWTDSDLPHYFNCLEDCCQDFDSTRIFRGLTCEMMVEFAGDGCETDISAPPLSTPHVPQGTLLKEVCPRHCKVCSLEEGSGDTCDAPTDDLSNYLRCLGSSCRDFDSTLVFQAASRCADLMWHGCDTPLTKIEEIMIDMHACSDSHEYDDLGKGQCRSTDNRGVTHYGRGFYRNAVDGLKLTHDQCKAACNAEQGCTGYMTGDVGSREEGYCKVLTSSHHAPSGWMMHKSPFTSVDHSTGNDGYHCWRVNQAAEEGVCVPPTATLAWACPATCGLCRANPEEVKIPCSSAIDCNGHGTTSGEDRSQGCVCACDGGWTGGSCNVPPPCMDAEPWWDCSHHGSVSDADRTNGCKPCDCTGGYSGNSCAVPPPCTSADCSNHGTTTDPDRTDLCLCTCTEGFTTEDELHPCAVPPPCVSATDCNGHGITDDLDRTNGCECACTDDFTGHQCQIPPPCTPLDCSGHGNSHDKDRTDGCDCGICSSGYTGQDCSVPPRCQNGSSSVRRLESGHYGTPVAMVGSRRLQYYSYGYYGTYADAADDDHNDGDCSGHGFTTDMDKTDGCTCTCTDDYTGSNCAEPPISCEELGAYGSSYKTYVLVGGGNCRAADGTQPAGYNKRMSHEEQCRQACDRNALCIGYDMGDSAGMHGYDCTIYATTASSIPAGFAQWPDDPPGHANAIDYSDGDEDWKCYKLVSGWGAFMRVKGFPPSRGRCNGLYKLEINKTHNGGKVWRSTSQERTLFRNDNGAWAIAEQEGGTLLADSTDSHGHEYPSSVPAGKWEVFVEGQDKSAADSVSVTVEQLCNGHGSTNDIDSADGCMCNCTDDYTGNNCGIPPPCVAADDCYGHGFTRDLDKTDGCDCRCTHGWSGAQCRIPPPCRSQQDCNGHGTTSDKDRTDGCLCHCTGGWSGVNCDVPPPCVAATDCSGHGSTFDLNKIDGCDCNCTAGYTGDSCAVPPPCIAQVDCSGHGTTTDKDRTDGCVCHCTQEFSGDNCHTPPPCTEKDCSHHGTTTDPDKTDGCLCNCTNDFTGDNCAIPPIPCDAMKNCHGHGTTADKDSANGCMCNCTDGYTGQNCGIPPPCKALLDCSGHGSTSDLDRTDGCDCECTNDYTNDGLLTTPNCSVPPPCHRVEDCSDHGDTTDLDKTDGCKCDCDVFNGTEYTGDDCAIPPPCRPFVDCSGHGTTTDKDRTDDCDCTCTGGFSGDDCQTPPPCSAVNDCSGHGTTNDLDKTDGCICKCKDGWTSRDCAVPPPCNAVVDCSNHGTTTDDDKTDGCDCVCSGDYTGHNCAIPPIPCQANTNCNGHGTTNDTDSANGCVCDCYGGYTGGNCRIPPPCKALKDCNGHGTSTDLDRTDGCECHCTGGFTGPNGCMGPDCMSTNESGPACTVPPPCVAATDCNGHGSTTDLDKTDGCQCLCDDDWSGVGCGVYSCRELYVPGGCHGLNGKEFWMHVNGYASDSLSKWVSFNWAGHWTLARYDLKENAMPLRFQKSDVCHTYKLQNKWTGEQADDKWLGYSSCGSYIQATSSEDEAAIFELVPKCNETLGGPQSRDYRGCQSQTRSGKTCQKWTAQTPHGHGNTPAERPGRGLGDHNQCRNPDGSLTIWCYTTDTAHRWEYCDRLPQSEWHMKAVSRGYMSYSEKDHTDHPKGSVQADYTVETAMTFNLHRHCLGPNASASSVSFAAQIPKTNIASVAQSPAVEVVQENLFAPTDLASETPATTILNANPLIFGCLVGLMVAVATGFCHSRRQTGDFYVGLADHDLLNA